MGNDNFLAISTTLVTFILVEIGFFFDRKVILALAIIVGLYSLHWIKKARKSENSIT